MRRSKILIFTLILTLFAFVGFSVKTNAATATSDLIKVEGAQVRTEGTVGIRFVGKIESSYTNAVTSYGIAVAFGDVEASQIIIGGTVNGMAILNAECDELDEDRNFFISLLGMPDNMYGQKVTTRAYVKNGSNVTYATTATVRSLAEVTIEAKNNNETGTNINNVVSKLSSSYKKAYFDSNKNYVIENIMEDNLNTLEAEFVKDWNNKFGTKWTEIVGSTFQKSASTGLSGNSDKDASPSNLFKFFKDKTYGSKWGWLLEFLLQYADVHPKNQIQALKSDDGIVTAYPLWSYLHLGYSIANFFNSDDATSGYAPIVFTDSSRYDNLLEYNNSIFSNLNNCDLYKVGSRISLPSALVNPNGSEFDGWYLGSTRYAANGNYVITSSNVKFIPKFVFNGTVNCTTTLNPNGGMFNDMTMLNGVTPLKTVKLTRYLSRTSDGTEASLHNNTIPAWWYYIGLNETAVKNIYEIVEISSLGATSKSHEFDYVVYWHSSLSDTTAKSTLTSIFNSASTYLNKLVVFDNVPASSSTAANITMKIISADALSGTVVKTYTGEGQLPTPVKESYTFVGWYDANDNKYSSVSDLGSNAVLTLTAKWKFDGKIIGAFEENSYVVKDKTIQLSTTYIGDDGTNILTWKSLNPTIATVDQNGSVKGVSEGLAEIVVSDSVSSNISFTFYVTVFNEEPTGLLKVLVDSNNEDIYTREDLFIGITPGKEGAYYTDVTGSVSKLLFEDYKVYNTYYLSSPSNKSTLTGEGTGGIDFVTFHYAADMPYSANYSLTGGKNLASYNKTCNTNGTRASWHYSTGNDGIWACQNEEYGAWHAGSSKTMSWHASGVTTSQVGTDVYSTDVTLRSDNYFYIKGVKTNIKNTTGYSYTKFNKMGLGVKLVGSQWYLSGHYYCSDYGYICSVGGNQNSIGIESSVRDGSDLWLTWQYSAQLCAKLLLKYNLPIQRLVGHHFFTGKWCPQPLLEHDLEIWYEFVRMVEQEMELYKNYSNSSLSFSSNSKYLKDNGRISSLPTYSECVTYTVTYTTGSTTKTVTLSSILPGLVA